MVQIFSWNIISFSFRECFIGEEDGGDLLIPSGDKLKELVCPLNAYGEIADLVNDEQFVTFSEFLARLVAFFKMELDRRLSLVLTNILYNTGLHLLLSKKLYEYKVKVLFMGSSTVLFHSNNKTVEEIV